MSNLIEEIATNPKVGGGVSVTTYGVSLESIIDLIPDNISKIVAMFSVLLAGTMIFYHLKKVARENREEERVKKAEERKRKHEELENEKLRIEIERLRKSYDDIR